MFIRQDGKQELQITLQVVGENKLYPLCDATIEYDSLFGAEWIHSVEFNNSILRLSLSTSTAFSYEGEKNMNYDNIYPEGSNPHVDSILYPHGSDSSFSMPNYKQISLFYAIYN